MAVKSLFYGWDTLKLASVNNTEASQERNPDIIKSINFAISVDIIYHVNRLHKFLTFVTILREKVIIILCAV